MHDIEVGFSPGKMAQWIILKAIQEAKISIDIAAYSFTSLPIALALVDAKARGVNIRMITDKKSKKGKNITVTYLVNHCVPIKLNHKYAIMHNKFMIIDNHAVETGSFNYTKSAACCNAENVLYLRHRPDIADKYTREFNRLWTESKDIQSKH